MLGTVVAGGPLAEGREGGGSAARRTPEQARYYGFDS